MTLFETWQPRLAHWHRVQDSSPYSGNCYYWWRSRWYDDHPPYVKGAYHEANSISQCQFDKVWTIYQSDLQRTKEAS